MIIFDVYGTLISTGTGSLEAAKILALQKKKNYRDIKIMIEL